MLALAGCAASEGADLVSREALVSTFEAGGEPVTLEFDLAKDDPESPMDAAYEGSGGTVSDTGFGLVLLDDDDAATKHAVGIVKISYGQLDVVRHENVVLVVASTMKAARKAGLVALVESL